MNFLEYWEVTIKDGIEKKRQRFCWVTDFEITRDNAYQIMRIGRVRWKIETVPFNSLKNQGYQLEHNFGLGKKHLSTIFTMFMMLAVLVDQAQQLSCLLFEATCVKCQSKKTSWEKLRRVFNEYLLDSMETFYRMIIQGYKRRALTLPGTG